MFRFSRTKLINFLIKNAQNWFIVTVATDEILLTAGIRHKP